MPVKTLDAVSPAGQRVLVRVDLNVPVDDGRVSDATRIERVVPTLRELVDKGATPILLSHFGRPKGKYVAEMSLRPILPALEAALGTAIAFGEDCVGPAAEKAVASAAPGAVVLLENTRFHAGEEANDPEFAEALARHAALFVNDAFSAAHRAHASTEGVARRLPSVAGRALQAEIDALTAALGAPERPVMAVVGGAKVSTKIALLGNLVEKVDCLVIGGGMANTFLAARGVDVGASLCERDHLATATEIEGVAARADCEILLPSDVVAAERFEAHAPHQVVAADACPKEAMILDAGPEAVGAIADRLARARTLVWNGPLGAFELKPFDAATNAAARQAAELTQTGRLMSIAGGGDTVAALNAAGAAERFTYVSTAGGAFLEWLEGKTLPGIAVLEADAAG